MKRTFLELEHRYKNRFVGRHYFKPHARKVMGSSAAADIRLLGEHVGAIHAALDFQDGDWVLSDLGSEQGTWIEKNPIVEQVITEPTEVQIGAHVLKLVPRSYERNLFNPEASSEATPSSGAIFHQVIVKKNGHVLETHLLEKGASFEILWRGQVHRLACPVVTHWIQTELQGVSVQQRLIHAELLQWPARDRISFGDRNVRVAAGVAALMVVLAILVVVFAPQRPDGKLNAIRPETNLYTKMIYDAKLMAEKRKEAMKQKKHIVGQARQAQESTATGNTEQPKVVQDKRSSGAKSARVISQVKAKQLGDLIGKISKRANLNALFVRAQGKNPDETTGAASGTESVARGTLVDKHGAPGTSTDQGGHKIGGVATAGKGGGSAQYKGVGGLSQGNVGNATVGVLEEETEVEGGLDRDVIARVIQSELGQIRYCYERQLSASPNLFGKVQVKFTIGADGKVVSQSVGSTTLQSAMVEGCILRRIAGWQFPKPRGGTLVMVSYPFLFRSTR